MFKKILPLLASLLLLICINGCSSNKNNIPTKETNPKEATQNDTSNINANNIIIDFSESEIFYAVELVKLDLKNSGYKVLDVSYNPKNAYKYISHYLNDEASSIDVSNGKMIVISTTFNIPENIETNLNRKGMFFNYNYILTRTETNENWEIYEHGLNIR